MTKINMLSATELLKKYADGSLSPVEVTKEVLATISRHNDTVNAFVMVDEEGALKAAKNSEERWQRGQPEGRLDGIPTTVKDLVIAKNWPTLRGSNTTDAKGPWLEDAPAVARLKEHNAVLLGKTTTPEFGWKGVTDCPLTGITRNPWNLEMTPGGSSGGAAVAAALGMGALHIGTDGGGSIRMPCAFTGIPGLKATFARVPTYPLSLLGTVSHLGPMTRTVGDSALMLSVLAEPDIRDPYSLPWNAEDYSDGLEDGVKGLRIAYVPTINDCPVDPEIAKLVKEAVGKLAELGAIIEQPQFDLPDGHNIFRIHWYAGASKILRPLSPKQRAMVDPALVEVATEGDHYSLAQYQDAVGEREAYCVAYNKIFENYDLIITPTLPLTAFKAGLEFPEGQGYQRWTDWTPFTYPFNLTGQPAGSVPCGFSSDGLPVAMQIVGPCRADALVLKAMRAYETICPAKMPDWD